MSFSRRTPQVLHEDHQETISVIEALDQMIAKAKRGTPDVQDPTVRNTLEKTARIIGAEVNTHFTFEEDQLFTRLEAAGDVGIGMHLREEHRAILPLGLEVADLAGTALENGFNDAIWVDFRAKSGELIERMFAHIQKEEMALLPILDDLLEPDEDMEISIAYAEIQ